MSTDLDVNDAALELADALGSDFTYLQPPEQKRFDPATVAVSIGYLLLVAAAAGITEGVKESAKTGTEVVLAATATAVKRWIRKLVPRAFGEGSDPSTVRECANEAELSVMAARQASGGLPEDVIQQLPETVGAAVREGLRESGLPDVAGARLERTVQVQINVIIQADRSS
ncbi:hypothetical protein GCM10012275_04390 [Longimycelium tulufanense]|uniref:Uncharacterized protein n=1 Tax=Longimycelium tulufanense TaxID=907463 RepID=A0A8J3C671_9PSEU|nr:hypothetical protein [Longimycelium tulufanense]GGM36274.1 hypothetical protein GCM10012275_04390 [Longimycelium tulufanense]